MEFITKDSGQRIDYQSGMRRDTADNKPRFDLIDQDMLYRWAMLMTRGANKYGPDNWRLANSQEELKRFKASAYRHFWQWVNEKDTDEDHAAAVMFNIAAAEYVKNKLSQNS